MAERETKVKNEIKKMRKSYADLIGGSQKDTAERLIKEISYMSVMLDEIKDSQAHFVEFMENGKQKMFIESAASKAYNALIKNYNASLKQLSHLLPDEMPNKNDKLDEFLK